MVMAAVFLLLVLGARSTWGANVPEMAGNKSLSVVVMGPSQYLQGAIAGVSLGFEEIERRQLLPGYTIDWTYRDTECNPFHGMPRRDDVIKWKHFRVTGHLSGEFTGHQ